MNARKSLVRELRSILAGSSHGRRAKTLQQLIDMFIDVAHKLQDAHIAVFDEVIGCLIEDIEVDVLREVGQRLARVPKAPPSVVNRLAGNPDIAVAGPILTHCERLSQPDLVTIASSKGQPHLLAISARKRLDPSVTEVLVRRGDNDVMQVLAANGGAAFSEPDFGILLQRGTGDGAIAERLAHRSDIAPDQLYALLERATAAIRKRLVAAAPQQKRAFIQAAVEKIARNAARVEASAEAYAHTIRRLVDKHGTLSEREIIDYASAKKELEVVSALSVISGVPPQSIEALMDGQRLEPLLMVCKAMQFPWPTVRAIVEMRPRSGIKMQDFLTKTCDAYGRQSLTVARQALKLWQARRSAAG